jgi:hypothetical protein
MRLSAVLVWEYEGRQVPICRTRRRELVEEVGRAAFAEVRAAAEAEDDEMMRVLLDQEALRLERGMQALGLAVDGRC